MAGWFFAVLVAGLASSSWAQKSADRPSVDAVEYHVAVADTAAHVFHVEAVASGIARDRKSIDWAIPAWSPGWYVLTHAYRNIHDVTAADETGAALTVAHPDALTWSVVLPAGTGASARSVAIRYDVTAVDNDPDALDLGLARTKSYGFFTPYLDSDNGFAPGPAMLMYVTDGKSAPCSVSYQVPEGWKIASANTPATDGKTFSAPDYDTLADQPADLGHFTRTEQTIAGVPVGVIIVGPGPTANTGRWIDRTFRLARAEIAFWGSKTPPPFPRYLFQFRFPTNEPGGGGLEHLNCTVITLDRSEMTRADSDDMELVAHEFFHAWNVKRARPEKLGPFDYTQPARVKDLWWSEGVTDYFAPHMVVAAGLADAGWWRGNFGNQIDELQHNPARRNVTVETASFKAWEGKSEGFGGLSYYNKGAVIGLLLDIEMRRRTDNRVGLIDLMKALLDEAAKTGRGFPDNEIERFASSLTKSDFGPFFTLALRSTDELPYDGILAAAGLQLKDAASQTAAYGITVSDDSTDSAMIISGVVSGGAAAMAGVQTGDRIVGLGGAEDVDLPGGNLPERLAAEHPGDHIQIAVLREGVRHVLPLVVGQRDEHKYTLGVVPHPTAQQAAILHAIDGTAPAE